MIISIIIPTYNRANALKYTLASVFNLNDFTSVEVIVVDNGSTDETREVCESFRQVHKELQYHYDAEPGLLTGRHLGASKATGDILCFIDDDVELTPGWLSGVKDAFKDEDVALATGPSLPAYESSPPAWLNYFWENAYAGKMCTFLSLIDLGNDAFEVHPNYAFGLNFCIRKTIFTSLSGFHPDCIPESLQMFQGDGETGLTRKAYNAGYKCLYDPHIKLYHIISAERLTVEYFKKRAFYEGVCNSFSSLREKRSQSGANAKDFLSNIKDLLRPLKNMVFRRTKQILQPDIVALKNIIQSEQQRGFDFHQKAYYSNGKVKDWVDKKDYWDYRLPS